MGNNNKSEIEYLFKQGQVNNYAVDDVLKHPNTSKTQSSFWTELQDRNETAQGCYHGVTIGDFKTAKKFIGEHVMPRSWADIDKPSSSRLFYFYLNKNVETIF